MNSEFLSEQKWLQIATILKQDHPMLTNQRQSILFLSRFIAENLLVFFLQYIGLTLSTLTQQTSPIWLASGTACAFIFLRGPTILPGIWAGGFIAYYFAKSGWLTAVECATLFTLQAQLLLWLSYRYIGPTLIFYRQKILIKFIFITAIVTAFISLGLTIACYNTLPDNFLWVQWGLANFNGILIIACALITWDAYFPQVYLLKKLNKTYLGLFYGALTALAVMLLLSQSGWLIILLSLASILCIIAIANYYGWCGCISAVCLLSFILFLMPEKSSEIYCQFLLLIISWVGMSVSIKQFDRFSKF